jgi:hypothetical protein
VASATGWDFVITAGDGVTKLNHEVESFASSTGALIAWVQVPFLSTTSTNLLFIYYGNAAATDQSNKTGVWSSYGGVWHLGNGISLSAGDSTANANNGAITAVTADSGKIGGAAFFNGGASQLVDMGDPANGSLDFGSGSFTYSLWVKPVTSLDQYDIPLWKGGSDAAHPGYDIELGTGAWNSVLNDGTNSPLSWFSASPQPDGTWQMLTAVIDRSANKLYPYLNGRLVNTNIDNLTSLGSLSNSNPLQLGGSLGVNLFYGDIDEVEIKSATLTPAWILTEYNNQSSPSTFTIFGNEEQPGGMYPVLMASSTPSTATGRVKYRFSRSAGQAAGVYTNIINYILIGTY